MAIDGHFWSFVVMFLQTKVAIFYHNRYRSYIQILFYKLLDLYLVICSSQNAQLDIMISALNDKHVVDFCKLK